MQSSSKLSISFNPIASFHISRLPLPRMDPYCCWECQRHHVSKSSPPCRPTSKDLSQRCLWVSENSVKTQWKPSKTLQKLSVVLLYCDCISFSLFFKTLNMERSPWEPRCKWVPVPATSVEELSPETPRQRCCRGPCRCGNCCLHRSSALARHFWSEDFGRTR